MSEINSDKGILHSHLSEIMGKKRWKLIDVIKRSGIGRNSCAKIYHEIDLDTVKLGTLEKICNGVGCSLSELISFEPVNRDVE